uniref:histidinol-phosphate transaminase n=1 Tax=Tetraselmis sp. GSL018 TaxID=582737 RepID=A0A061SME3_9CHLO
MVAKVQVLPSSTPAPKAAVPTRRLRSLDKQLLMQRKTSLLNSTVSNSETPLTADLNGTTFLRPHLLQLAPYTPIEPFEVLSQKLGRAPEEIVKLDANENPYGPPPEVREALGNVRFPHIYPDPESRALRAALSEWAGVPMEHILVGCGADELIDLIMRCVLDPGDAILNCPPTFGMYSFDAAVNDARVISVTRNPDFSLDVDGIVRAVKEHSPKVVFLTSPNNPDGGMMSEEELLRVLDLPVLVVLDEAYVEFSEAPSRAAWVASRPNLVVLRTFSKMAALAGVRVGYGFFPLDMIQYLWAEVAACAALSNKAYLLDVKARLVEERDRLHKLLQGVDFLEPYPTSSNFILCKVTGGALALKQALMERGVMVRHYASPGLENCVRISVGKPEQTDLLMAALAGC